MVAAPPADCGWRGFSLRTMGRAGTETARQRAKQSSGMVRTATHVAPAHGPATPAPLMPAREALDIPRISLNVANGGASFDMAYPHGGRAISPPALSFSVLSLFHFLSFSAIFFFFFFSQQKLSERYGFEAQNQLWQNGNSGKGTPTTRLSDKSGGYVGDCLGDSLGAGIGAC